MLEWIVEHPILTIMIILLPTIKIWISSLLVMLVGIILGISMIVISAFIGVATIYHKFQDMVYGTKRRLKP